MQVACDLFRFDSDAIQLTQMGIQIGATEGKVYGEGLDATLYGQEFKRLSETASNASMIGFVV